MADIVAGALAGSSVLGSIISGFGKKSSAKKAYKRQRKLRRSAYQDTMGDMAKAGLNPILAYKQGATNAATVNMAPVPDFGEALARGTQAGVATAKEKREAETATPLRKSQETVYLEQLENLRKEGRLLDQRWETGAANARESMIRANWMAHPEGIRTVIRNYIGGAGVTGRTVAEASRLAREAVGGLPKAQTWLQRQVEAAGGRPVDPGRQTWEQGIKEARENPWFPRKKSRYPVNRQDKKRRRPRR